MVWTCRKLPDGNGKNNENRAHLSPVFICLRSGFHLPPVRFSFASGSVFRPYPACSLIIDIKSDIPLKSARIFFYLFRKLCIFITFMIYCNCSASRK